MNLTFKNCKNIEYIILGLTILLLIYAAITLFIQTGLSWLFNADYLDKYGSFVGGIAALISIYYLYQTLKEQGRQFQIQNFESKYFELIKFNREKANSLINRNSNQNPSIKLMELFVKQIEEAIHLVDDMINTRDIRTIYTNEDEFNSDTNKWGGLLKERTIINISFLIVFFGVNKNGYNLLINRYLRKYDRDTIKEILKNFRLKINGRNDDTEYHDPVELSAILNDENKYYLGFQHESGNYFRTMFQCVKYVNKQPFLCYTEKYEYIKILRCQMSNAEEKLLFYDTISDLGAEWEYNTNNINDKLITKYNFIKNIPLGEEDKYSPIKFYPNINFEASITIPRERSILEAKYT